MRLPKAFVDKYGNNLPRRIGIKYGKHIWPAKYNIVLKKIYGIGYFMRYYGFGVYCVAQLDYYGDGMFEVKVFRETGVECHYPSCPSNAFFKKKEHEGFSEEEFVLDLHSLEFEKRFSLFCFNTCRNTIDYVEMRIIGLYLLPNIDYVYLDYSWEKFYRKWDNGSHVVLARSKWKVEIRWMNNKCVFANGWVAFAKEIGLEAGDYLLLLHKSPKKEFQTLNICIFKAKDCRPSSDDEIFEEEHCFFKMVSRVSTDEGFFVLRRLVNKRFFNKLYQMNQIEVGGERWFIFYNARNGYLHNLEDMMVHFNVSEKEAIVFSMDSSNIICGRIYGIDGMEISYKRRSRNKKYAALENWFLRPDIEFDSSAIFSC